MSDPFRSANALDPFEARLTRAGIEAAARRERLAALNAPEREALLGDEILLLRAELARVQAEMAALLASRSWRLTGPLRALGRGLKRRG